jgi:pyrroline-5-carboxylate reductase
VFLAVHPPVLAEAAGVIKDSLKPAALVVCGATRTLLESGLTPAEVMDLIPVKPLAEMEPQITELYRTRLPGLYQKIKP